MDFLGNKTVKYAFDTRGILFSVLYFYYNTVTSLHLLTANHGLVIGYDPIKKRL